MTSTKHSSGLATSFGSELSLSGMLRIEESLLKRLETNDKPNAQNTVDTASCSEWTFSSLEESERVMLPRSILKNTTSKDSMIENSWDKDLLRAWIEQPIPSPTTPKKRRRRRLGATQTASPNKYDLAKTRFPGRDESTRSRQEPRVRGPRHEKTVEEQWVRTCRFLW